MRILLISAYTILFLTTQAQQFMPKLGMSLSTVKIGEGIVAPGYEMDYRIGIVAGGEVHFSFGEKYGLAMNLLFHQKGWKGGWDQNEEKVRLDYIDVAAMPFVKILPFYIMAGASLGCGTGGKYTAKSQGRITSESKVIFNQPNRSSPDLNIDERIDFAAQFVVGIVVRKNVFLDLRYQPSFTDLFAVNTSKSRCFQFTMGYLITRRPRSAT